jgi:hypothetical protein
MIQRRSLLLVRWSCNAYLLVSREKSDGSSRSIGRSGLSVTRLRIRHLNVIVNLSDEAEKQSSDADAPRSRKPTHGVAHLLFDPICREQQRAIEQIIIEPVQKARRVEELIGTARGFSQRKQLLFDVVCVSQLIRFI